MKVVGRDIIDACIKHHPKTRPSLESWLAEAERAQWATPMDVKASYGNATIRPGSVVLFNIKGRDYRMAVRISYPAGVVRVLEIGTHSEYDHWDY